MARYAVNLPSGKTDQEGFLRLFGKVLSGSGVVASGDLAVAAQPTPDMTVSVAAGDAAIFSGSTLYHGWATTPENVTIPANSSGVTKITAVVASIDTAAASATANNPNGMVYQTFTLGGTDTATPTDAQISTGIGGRPFTRLANVTVANGVTSINSGNIVNTRVVSGVSRIAPSPQLSNPVISVSGVSASGSTRVKIGEVSLSSTSATITFSSIPAAYRHLTIEWLARGTSTAEETVAIRFNGDASASYDFQSMDATGAGLSAAEGFGQTNSTVGSVPGTGQAASIYNSGIINIPLYANTFSEKQAIAHCFRKAGTATGNLHTEYKCTAWRNTASITSITLFPGGGSFAANSLFTLYGEP